MSERIRVGISACLLGHEVRWNGGHSRDSYITDTLGKYLEFVPVCPEVEAGFPIPRETLRLVGDPKAPRLVTTRTNVDHTERMLTYAARRVQELETEDLCGFIFKSGSPSSGMERVKVFITSERPVKQGVGLFARAFMERFPLLPVEEEGRLHDPKLRENFIEAIFALKRWRDLKAQASDRGAYVAFHTHHKLLLLSHNPQLYREMGQLVAAIKEISLGDFCHQYETLFLKALRTRTTIKKHVNVLHHVMGYFKKHLTPDEKQELLEVIEAFRAENVPLIVPITLLNHYVRKYQEPYLKTQWYLNPHPLELRLRNHA